MNFIVLLPGGASGKNPTANAGDIRDVGSIPGCGRNLSTEELMLLNCGVGEDS